ncbi:Charged multivesicular body protein 6 Chromatin-modifying protein 6 [Larimichthys crocea]|uniref:Charged multivesicular body protein 6 Chromatin-modifying protein 6 n=1 Tax=Larimichthys crocea TaxID=215358 RepID=A0A6G0HXE2_LARCR|nr:Charged multivesicular body protein 6 Chromatin-modifying protein 6 [Larimichthys crocea]
MGNLFGKKKPSRVTEQDKAVLQLKQQRDKLRQYQKRIHLQLEKERRLAKQLLKDGKKEKALLLLKKKRYQDQLLDKTENQIGNLERMVQDLEFAQIEKKVIDGLKVGNECLKKMHKVMSIEEVERILDETQDSIEYQRQIDEMLAGSLSQEDEDAVLAELEAITQGDAELPDVPSDELPEVPAASEEKPERDRPRKKPERELLAA